MHTYVDRDRLTIRWQRRPDRQIRFGKVLLTGLVIALMLFSGCRRMSNSAVEPVLIITLGFPNWSPHDADDVVRQLGDHAISIDDARLRAELDRSSCTFAADFSTSLAPDFQSNGMPGTSGFNVHLTSLRLNSAANLTRPCPADSTPVEFVFDAGGSLNVHGTTNDGSAQLGVSGSQSPTTFRTDQNQGFFEFTLSSLDVNNHVATGSFRIILRNSNDPRVLFASGSFTMPAHIR